MAHAIRGSGRLDLLRLVTSTWEPLELAERRPQTRTLRSPQPQCLEITHARGPRLRNEDGAGGRGEPSEREGGAGRGEPRGCAT